MQEKLADLINNPASAAAGVPAAQVAQRSGEDRKEADMPVTEADARSSQGSRRRRGRRGKRGGRLLDG